MENKYIDYLQSITKPISVYMTPDIYFIVLYKFEFDLL